jgi:hypothetical protein
MDLEKSYVAHLSDNDGHAALNTDHGDYDQGYGGQREESKKSLI